MRELTCRNWQVSIYEYIVYGGEPGELKHLSNRRKRKKRIDFLSSGERKGKSPNLNIEIYEGVRTCKGKKRGSRSCLERQTEESYSLVDETQWKLTGIRSTAGHEESGGKAGGPSPKAKYDLVTDRV
jgi:hypothetical protein